MYVHVNVNLLHITRNMGKIRQILDECHFHFQNVSSLYKNSGQVQLLQ